MPQKPVTEKRAIALSNLRTYFGTLPYCDVDQYGPEAKAEHEQAQRRVLDLCASDDDRTALAEFCLGFTYWLDMFRAAQRPGAIQWSSIKDATDERRLTQPTTDPAQNGAQRRVLSCMAVCECATCKCMRGSDSLASVAASGQLPDDFEERMSAALANLAPKTAKA